MSRATPELREDSQYGGTMRGVEASPEEADRDQWCNLHTARPTYAWVGYVCTLLLPGEPLGIHVCWAPREGNLFLDQALYLGEGYLLTPGWPQIPCLSLPRCWDYRHVVPIQRKLHTRRTTQKHAYQNLSSSL